MAQTTSDTMRGLDSKLRSIHAVGTNIKSAGLREISNGKGETITRLDPGYPKRSYLGQICETAMVVWSIYDGMFLALGVCSLLFIRSLRIPVILYMFYVRLVANSHQVGTTAWRLPWLRSLGVWKFVGSYFPITLYRSVPLSPARKYIFGYHPHGIMLRGAVSTFSYDAVGFSELFPGLTTNMLVKDETFNMAGHREYVLATGMNGVSKRSCLRLLSEGGSDGKGAGNSIAITLGGSREFDVCRPNSMDVVIKIRKGFVKVAVETGADIVPVLGFGENDIYASYTPKEGTWGGWFWGGMDKHLKVKPPHFFGRFYDLTPYRRPIHVVVGKPITVEARTGEPDLKYVDELHSKYIEELQRIWRDWRDLFEPNHSVELKIVE